MTKIFRHSPHRAVDSMKILVGNKTNATIRDLEETEEDIEELTGVVVSIDKDKITGDGWIVKGEDGVEYNCSLAYSMYELPETEEYGGMYYPTEVVSVKFTKNPVLRTNTITEITSLGEDETKLDLSKWKHGDKPTTIIAKPKSAISLSDNMITFNYDNVNEVIADADGITTSGDSTNINTNNLVINSNQIDIQGVNFTDYLRNNTLQNLASGYNQTNLNGININQAHNLTNLNISKNMYISATEMILFDLVDPRYFPEQKQLHPLLTGSEPSQLYIYPNGLVTVQRTDSQVRINKDVEGTINWITPQYNRKNVLSVVVLGACNCCNDYTGGIMEYFNYCPHCKTWNTLYVNNGVIKCNTCSNTWCTGCGHMQNTECNNTAYNLKEYSKWTISGMATNCAYCKDRLQPGLSREYANYCPKCHKWGYLHIEDHIVNNNEQRVLHCSSCNEDYCLNCSISQGNSFLKNFINDDTYISKSQFEKDYWKLTHIRDE